MRKIMLSVAIVAMLSGCASAEYDDAINRYHSGEAQCLSQYGGIGRNFGSVPKENIVAAVTCVNQVEEATLIPVYRKWGYNTGSTYQGQAAVLNLAHQRELGNIDGNTLQAAVKQVFSLQTAELHQQEGAKRAQSNQLINSGLAMMAANANANPYDQNAQMARAMLQARGVNMPVEPVTSAPMPDLPRRTNCWVSPNGRNVNCVEQ